MTNEEKLKKVRKRAEEIAGLVEKILLESDKAIALEKQKEKDPQITEVENIEETNADVVVEAVSDQTEEKKTILSRLKKLFHIK